MSCSTPGGVVEKGTHDELIRLGGHYAELYKKQLLEEEAAAASVMSFHEEEVLGKAYDARLMRRLLAYLRPHKWYVAGALLALIGDAVTQLAPPYLVKIAIDQYIAQGDLAGLNSIALVYLAVLVAAFSLEYAQTYMMQMIGQRIMFDMRMQIYAHLQRLDLSFYDRNPVGRLMTRVTTDVDVINDLFTSGVVAAFGDLFMLVGIMVTLLWMDWRLALIAFSVLPLILVLAQWFRRNVRESYRKVRLRIARINAFLNEHINGMATVQLFRREEVNYGAVRRSSTASIATPTSSRFSSTRCFCRRSSSSRRSRRR